MTAELSGCVIVTGAPGAGKSTVTELAARLLPRAARIRGDDVNLMIISGRVGFLGSPPAEAERQGDLCNHNLSALAANFVDYGFTAFMDTVVADRAELDMLLARLRPRPVRMVVLAPGAEVCRQRDAGRDPEDRFAFDGYDRLAADMRRDLGDLAWWYDTSALTPQDTAARLVREATVRAPLLS